MSQSNEYDFPRTLADMERGSEEHTNELNRLRSLSLGQRRRNAVKEYQNYLAALETPICPEMEEIFAHAYEHCAATLTHLNMLADDAEANEDADNWNEENVKLARQYGMAYSLLTDEEFEQFKMAPESVRLFLAKFFTFYGTTQPKKK